MQEVGPRCYKKASSDRERLGTQDGARQGVSARGTQPVRLPTFCSPLPPGICKVCFCVWPSGSRSSLWSQGGGGRLFPHCVSGPCSPQHWVESPASSSGAEEKDCIIHILKTPVRRGQSRIPGFTPHQFEASAGPSLPGKAQAGKVLLPDRKLERVDQRKVSFSSVEHRVLGSGLPDAQIGSDPCNSLPGPIFSKIMAVSHSLPKQSKRIVEGKKPQRTSSSLWRPPHYYCPGWGWAVFQGIKR